MTRNKINLFAKHAVLVVTGAFLAMALSDASAANKWFTARTVNGRTQPLSAGTQTITMPDGRTLGISSATISNALIDLVISLYNNPTGDDNGNTQDVDPASASQDAYEKIIQYFADGVYEQTDGVHALRNVRIYRNGQRSDADVIWQASGGPCAWYLNQQGISANIAMYDKFNTDVFTNAAQHEAGGYGLAHEFGHYFYGLLDEYCVWDIGQGKWVNVPAGQRAQPCIMNDQWRASGRDYRWLNHSIRVGQTSSFFVDYECRMNAAQYQLYNDGAWPVMSRDPASDPNTVRQQWYRPNRGVRMYYPELAAKAPAGMNPPKIDLSISTRLADLASRQNLNILWMGSNMVVEIIMDKSSYMSDVPLLLGKAKQDAKLLVDLVPDNSAVGVSAYDDVVSTYIPLTVVTSATMRAYIKTAIDGISDPHGAPAMGDAALDGLSQMQSFGHTNFTRVAFLLSSGKVNLSMGVNPEAAAAAYQAAQIPIMTFGYGPSEDYVGDLLYLMAYWTGGKYY